MIIYAIIPARSGSKGLPNKNIKEIGGKPLLGHSIEFARKLDGINRVFCSTDNIDYGNIAIKFGAEVPFLRSEDASKDSSMEQDILLDMRQMFSKCNIPEPDIVVWLRPTFIFRSLHDVNKCISILVESKDVSSSRIVVESENRLYNISEDNFILPNFNDFGKSMVRRQDIGSSYKVFNTDVFRFKFNDFNVDYLGNKVVGVVSNKICGLDIDDNLDFEIAKTVFENYKNNEYTI